MLDTVGAAKDWKLTIGEGGNRALQTDRDLGETDRDLGERN